MRKAGLHTQRPVPLLLGPLASRRQGWGWIAGLDPLGRSGHAEAEGPEGPRSLPKPRRGAWGLSTDSCESWAMRRGGWGAVRLRPDGRRERAPGNLGLGSGAAQGRAAHSAHSRAASVPPPRGCSARRAYRKAWRRRASAARTRADLPACGTRSQGPASHPAALSASVRRSGYCGGLFVCF